MTKALRAAIAALLALGLFGCGNENTTYVDETNENVGRFHSEVGDVGIITDTRTDVQYLTWWTYNNAGGICVLVDADGKPLLAGEVEDE